MPASAERPPERSGQGTPPSSGSAATPVAAPLSEFVRSVSWREPRVAWQQLLEQFGLTKLVAGGALIVLVLAAFLLPGGAERGDPFDGPGAAMDLMLKLGAVLALAYVSMAALKRYAGGTVSQRGSLLEVLDSTSLGPNRAVYVVRAGEKRLVLGVTQHGITPLGELDEAGGQ